MAESIDRLKRKRSTIRALTTKLLQKIERGIGDTTANVDELEEALKQLSVKETTLKDIDRDIEQGTDDLEELDSEIQGAQEYQDKIIVWKCRANKRIQKENEDASTSVSSSVREVAPSTVKLPRLTLNKFNGDASIWQTFWSQYEAAINTNPRLTKVDKFNYLKSYLEGTAANAVSGLSLTDENYDSAIIILTERFGRKDLVINAHMNKLLSLTPVKRSSDVGALRKLYDICEIQVRSLESLGVVTDTYGSILCPILLKMIPEDIALEFNRSRTGDKEWNVRELLKFLQIETESRERTAILTKSENNGPAADSNSRGGFKYKQASQYIKGNSKYNIPSAAALNATTETKCVFCDKQNHTSENCKNLSLDERLIKIRKQGRCFVCLGTKHIAKFCKEKINPCGNCGRRHNKSVCKQDSEVAHSAEAGKGTVVSSVSQGNAGTGSNKTVLLQTASVLAVGKDKNRVIRCLLDGGSQRTFIEKDTSRALELEIIGKETLNIHTFGSQTTLSTTCNKVKVFLKNLHNNAGLELEALETPQICSATISVPDNDISMEMKSRCLQPADLPQDEEHKPKITILIGADYYWQVVSGRVERLNRSLVALDTKFGWCVQGPTTLSGMTPSPTGVMNIFADERESLSKQLRTFWELESVGITDKEQTTLGSDEEEAMRQFESNIVFKDGRYEVGLPWREDRDPLPSNFRIAEKRFKDLVRRLKANVTLHNEYSSVINDQIKRGIVELVRGSNSIDSKQGCYFMPHHAVIKREKATTKLRVVYDASSHENGYPSLNDCLLQGPNLNPDLLVVLLKFRQHKIAFMADIEQAFLQISIAEKDRDFVRFLWFDGSLKDQEDPKVVMLRMTRVLFGVTSSPFLLSATVRHHARKYETVYPEGCVMLKECLYVDDLISGTENADEAYAVCVQLKEIMKAAGMNLRKWKTNSRKLQELWQEGEFEQIIESPESAQPIEQTPLKVLGLTWNSETDEFAFQMGTLLQFLTNKQNTKRYVLQVSARIFDPIGFLSPFIVRIKCLFQVLWERGLDWDVNLPRDLQSTWDEWCAELPGLCKISVPRHYFSQSRDEIVTTQLHGFCDASERAYGAVIYVRHVTRTGTTGTTFVTAKTRVAPLKRMTLPRLELMGALVAARLIANLKDVFDTRDTCVYLWTDSTIALHWIRGPSRQWKTFVSNRVVEIGTLTDPQSWRHCRSQDNPADLLSRGCPIGELSNSNAWWTGPTWLKQPESEWPNKFPKELTSEEGKLELRRRSSPVVQLKCATDNPSEELLDLNKFSSLRRVLRITAWVQRFVHNSRRNSKHQTGPLLAEELSRAELYWTKATQLKSFQEELERLKAGKPVSRNSRIAELNPFLDENNLICAGGRLQQAGFSSTETHPRILHPKQRFTELLLISCHERVLHSGLRDTLVEARERYWIPRGRQLAKCLIQKCMICRKFKAKAGMQVTAPLPRDRIEQAKPFEVTGVDFAGPLYVKGRDKAYIALFTCAVTRAVHLELVTDLRTYTFLMALRRFLSRRGMCRTIYSDNAKTFKRANDDLKELWNSIQSQDSKDFYGHQGISWKFIVERAAWWGGFWERLVRSVKTCLRKTLGKTSLTFEELQTKLTEVEAVLNSRPITFTYTEAGEPAPLSPAHFLVGRRLTSLPEHSSKKQEITSTRGELTKRWKYQSDLTNRIWTRWQKDYLLELKSAYSSKLPQRITTIKTGDIVIVKEDKTPRLMWKTGRVVETFPGRDNKVRSCSVRLSSGVTLKRPIQLLYPLEITD